jgi:formiminoglutamase
VEMCINEPPNLHLFVVNQIKQHCYIQHMELIDYLEPVNPTLYSSSETTNPRTLVNVLELHSKKIPDLSDIHIAIVGVADHRFSDNTGVANSADAIRCELYKLIQPKHNIRVADLGNIRAGATMTDTLFALNAVTQYLLKQKVFVLILGGTSDLGYAQYTAYQGINRSMQLVVCDADIELLPNDQTPEESAYLHKIISHQPAYLFNISHLCAQQYFIEQESVDAFERMNFDVMRLGTIQQKLQDAEPVLRNADMCIFSMNAIRAADAPSSISSNPNGLYGEEACQLMRYAGMGNELTSLGIFDLDSSNDLNNRSAKLASQMIWYLFDGFYSRMNDYPSADHPDYISYRTIIQNHSYEIVFYKHALTDRWWMEVPYPNEKSKHQGKFMVPCSYNDYQLSLKDEIPDRWMKAYQKLMI